MRSRRLAAASLAALLLAACSGDDTAPRAQEPSPSPSPPPVCPLSGKRAPAAVDVTRPALAVKIENAPQARPQSGLERAEVVFEEVVEGGITRFMAVFHCADVKKAGPVRSARFDDTIIAAPFTRVIAYSGANDIVEKELKKQGMVRLKEKKDVKKQPFYRIPPGSEDIHSLYVNTFELRDEIGDLDLDPPVALRFGPLPGKAKKARTVTMGFRIAGSIEYRWEDGAWKRYEDGTAFMTESGKQIAPENLLVLEVTVNNSKELFDTAGYPSPDLDLIGKGKALLFRDGKVVKGTWMLKRKGGAPILLDRSGQPFVFSPGATWVELLPSAHGEVKGTFSFH